MSNEKFKPGKENPWGKGDEYEKKLGEEETRRIRGERELVAEAVKGQERNIEKDVYRRFRERLEGKRGNFADVCFLDDQGRVEMRDREADAPDLELSTRLVSGGKEFITTEDMRNTAQRISEEYPDITFTFDENPQRDRFLYTAMIKKSEE
jgi:hypothetical protein